MARKGEYAFLFNPGSRLLECVESDMTGPNGVIGTKDGKTLYLAAQKSIYRIRMNIKGVWSN